jgi:post-segregation antitoxin (ccd killing protein)
MPKRTGKREEMRSFSFRMPRDVFDDLENIARARGVDVSGVLNWLISEARPRLLEELAEHEKKMAEAIASREWEKAGSPAEAMRLLRDLLRKLQDEYTALSDQVLSRDERRAG